MKSQSINRVTNRIPRMATVLLLGLGAWSANSVAGTATDNLAVSASVTANCTISTGALTFGSYDPIVTNKAANLDGTGSVSVTCTNGADWKIGLGQGSNADTGSTDAAPLRQMSDGGSSLLSYALYSDAGRSVVWGNTDATDVDGTGDGTAQANTVYAEIASDQNVIEGSYSDTVVATVTF